jgi:hypothetical protein
LPIGGGFAVRTGRSAKPTGTRRRPSRPASRPIVTADGWSESQVPGASAFGSWSRVHAFFTASWRAVERTSRSSTRDAVVSAAAVADRRIAWVASMRARPKEGPRSQRPFTLIVALVSDFAIARYPSPSDSSDSQRATALRGGCLSPPHHASPSQPQDRS